MPLPEDLSSAANPEDHLSAGASEGAAVHDTQQVTAKSVDEAVGGRQRELPPDVRSRVEELFAALNASRVAVPAESNWSKSAADRANMVELAGLLYEYSNVIPELMVRTEGTLSAQLIRKVLKNASSVSDVETKVIELLEDKCKALPFPQEGGKGRRVFSDDQKREVVALMRLLRKRDLSTEGMNAFLETYKLSPAMIATNWVPLCEKAGVPILTADLVPTMYKRARKELAKDQEGGEEGGAPDVPAQKSGDEPSSARPQDAPATEAADVTSHREQVDETEVRPDGSSALSNADRKLIERIVEQNGPLASYLLEASADDVRSPAIRSLLELNTVAMYRLLGGERALHLTGIPHAEHGAVHAKPSQNGERLPHDTVNVNGHQVEVPRGAKVSFVIEQTRFEVEQPVPKPPEAAHVS